MTKISGPRQRVWSNLPLDTIKAIEAFAKTTGRSRPDTIAFIIAVGLRAVTRPVDQLVDRPGQAAQAAPVDRVR